MSSASYRLLRSWKLPSLDRFPEGGRYASPSHDLTFILSWLEGEDIEEEEIYSYENVFRKENVRLPIQGRDLHHRTTKAGTASKL